MTNPPRLTIAKVGSQHNRLLHSGASYAICLSSSKTDGIDVLGRRFPGMRRVYEEIGPG